MIVPLSAQPPAAAARHTHGEALVFLLLGIIYFLMTWGVNWKYSIDLQVLRDVVEIYPFREDFGSAFVDNSALVWLILKADWLADSETLLKLLYIGTFLFKTALLLRFMGSVPTVAFTALFFFSIDLNQARMALAISLLLLAFVSGQRSRYVWSAVLVAAAVVCHYPGSMVLLLFFLAAWHPRFAMCATVATVALVTAILLGEDSPILRYLIYIEDAGEGGQASFFIVSALLTATFWSRLSLLQRLVMVGAVAVSFFMRDLLSLSGRVSELSATAMLLWCYRTTLPDEKKFNANAIFLTVGILFLMYRVGQWVVLDQVPQPSNL